MQVLALCVLSYVSLTYAYEIAVKHNSTTDGESGVQCGDSTKCLDSGMCVNGTCVCNPADVKQRIQGDGSFACYKKNTIIGSIRSEPYVKTYDDETYQLNLPCRVLMTKFTTELKRERKRSPTIQKGLLKRTSFKGKCHCEVNAWQKKVGGKFFPHGFDLSCDMTNYKSVQYRWSVRMHGTADDGTYSFTEEGSWGEHGILTHNNGSWNDGPVDIDHMDGYQVKSSYDPINNIGYIDQLNCGFRVQFRPFDQAKGRNQIQPNGVSFGISSTHLPILTHNNMTMMTGGEAYEGLPFESAIIDGLTAEESFLYRALTSAVDQNHPDASSQCASLSSSVQMCDDPRTNVAQVQTAMHQCKWLLHTQRFIKCVDDTDNGDTILKLFNMCFNIQCRSFGCINFLAVLKYSVPPKCIDAEMRTNVKMLDNWLNEDYCVLGPVLE